MGDPVAFCLNCQAELAIDTSLYEKGDEESTSSAAPLQVQVIMQSFFLFNIALGCALNAKEDASASVFSLSIHMTKLEVSYKVIKIARAYLSYK